MHRERLIALRDALIEQQAKEDANENYFQFNFDTYARVETREVEYGSCGSCGCAIGMLPLIFPTYFKVIFSSGRGEGYICSLDYAYDNIGEVRQFFDITYRELTALFVGRYYSAVSGVQLGFSSVRASMVAERIDILLRQGIFTEEQLGKFL